MSGAVAVFAYADWEALYPELSNVSAPQAQLCFNMATLFLRNDGTGLVNTTDAQTSLLYMLTAHIAFINYGDNKSNGAAQMVGRISGATEGSVSVQTENQYPPGSPQWFQQTKYGSMYWQATAAFRTFRYRAGPGVYRGLGVGQGMGGGFLGGGLGIAAASAPWLYPNQ